MRLTALEIQQQTFENRFRGYDRAQVTTFLDVVRAEFERIVQANLTLHKQLEAAEREIGALKEREGELQRCLVEARRAADDIVDRAKEQANVIEQQASQKADRILLQVDERAMNLREEIQRLHLQRRQLQSELRGLLHHHLDMLSDAKPDMQAQLEDVSEHMSTSLDLGWSGDSGEELAVG